VIGVCSVIPVLVAYARLYRGMHHLSDVVVGAINGLACAALAAHCLLPRAANTNRGYRLGRH
jgi:membrane-associated phospholipid phosphatase